jgi:hypothetical protein
MASSDYILFFIPPDFSYTVYLTAPLLAQPVYRPLTEWLVNNESEKCDGSDCA